MTGKIKRVFLLNLPYVLIALGATKIGEAWRFSVGVDISQKVLHLMEGFILAFHSPWPSLLPQDLILGIGMACGIKLAVYVKGRNAKKYRKNIEYGSARWGRPEDIKPFIDPTFRNNVILTETERLTMNNRPKDPRLARNKNVMVVGGSGSGKTRFWLKPNLMQCHSSYVVTEPKDQIQPSFISCFSFRSWCHCAPVSGCKLGESEIFARAREMKRFSIVFSSFFFEKAIALCS